MSDDSSSVASSSDESEQPTTKKQRIAAPLELAPSVQTTSSKSPRIIVLLDQATLETVKNHRGVYELLNCDDHRDLCRKKLKRDPNEFRPDILHQELLSLLDSPLNKAGMLQVYIRTAKGVLIEVNPVIRIPRTFKRFSGLMVQLLHKMKIKAGTESTTLLKVIKNPFSQHLPPGTRCYGFSCQGSLYSPISLARKLLPETIKVPTCFIVGAMSTGHVTMEDHPYMEEMLSISEYPLSGAAALSRIMGGIEHHWGIV
jgi:rRNA small subunit pseudouridine methyltransferase Nep1